MEHHLFVTVQGGVAEVKTRCLRALLWTWQPTRKVKSLNDRQNCENTG